jgi:hypothetical protein
MRDIWRERRRERFVDNNAGGSKKFVDCLECKLPIKILCFGCNCPEIKLVSTFLFLSFSSSVLFIPAYFFGNRTQRKNSIASNTLT